MGSGDLRELSLDHGVHLFEIVQWVSNKIVALVTEGDHIRGVENQMGVCANRADMMDLSCLLRTT